MNTKVMEAKTVILYTSSKLILTLSVAIFLCSSVFVFNQDAYSQDSVCLNRIIEQITSDPLEESFNPSINSDGTRIALVSDADINGGNPEANSELYLFDTTNGILTQITAEMAGDSGNPSINSDGTRIAFSSEANINGGNPENNTEIYLFDTTTGIFTQITDETAEASQDPSINSDGTRIAFRSRANINGGNPDGNDEIYLFNTTTGTTTQITDEIGDNSSDPSINSDGTRIAFQTRADINGGNPDGNREIYLFDTTTGVFTQITDEMGGGSFEPSINSDGTRIAFTSDSDIDGGNPEGNFEIYLFDTTAGAFTQITDETAGSSSFDPSINSGGSLIAFASDANINGGNPDGNEEVYLFDATTGTTTQITNQTDVFSSDPSINSDGTRIAFVSNSNPNGTNPDGNAEVFLSICLEPRDVPTLSEWGLIAMAGVLGLVGFMVMRRKIVTS